MSEQMPNLTNNDEKVLLKTSFFGGFDKKEVLSYIDNLREQNRVMGQELETHINEVSTARNELSQQVSSFESKLSEMERQLEERSGKIKELTGMIDSLKEEIGDERQKNVEQKMQLQRQFDANKLLEAKAKQFEFKAKRYDDVSAQIGDIMLEAKQSASEVIERAETQAQEIKGDAVITTKRITLEMKNMRTELVEVRRQIEQMLGGLNSKLDEIDSMIAQITPPDDFEELYASEPLDNDIVLDFDDVKESGEQEEELPAVEEKFFR